MLIHTALAASQTPRLSYEVFPPREKSEIPKLQQTVEALDGLRPLFIAVTCGAGGTGPTGTMETCGLLASSDTPMMPHMTCTSTGPETLADRLEAMRAAGVRNVLAVRGDLPKSGAPIKGFTHASDMVEAIARLAPDMGIGVAAFPDVHPESPSIDSDLKYLKLKFDAGASFGVTQLFFDNRRYYDLVDRLAGLGCEAPIIPAVLPLRSLAQVKRATALCDAPVPGKILATMERLTDKDDQAGLKEYCIDLAAEQVRGLIDHGAPCVHLYPFNRADVALEVAHRCGLAQ